MQTDREEKRESPPNTETRELFLYASADDLPARGLLVDTDDSETELKQAKSEASKDE